MTVSEYRCCPDRPRDITKGMIGCRQKSLYVTLVTSSVTPLAVTTMFHLMSVRVLLVLGICLQVAACVLASVSDGVSDSNHSRGRMHLNIPTFDANINQNISTQIEHTVRLQCRINKLEQRTVSWIRHDANKILTIGDSVYTLDKRFSILRTNDTRDWILQIKYPVKQDSGKYECQVSTQPKKSFIVQLNVIVGKVQISGPDIVDIGDTLVIKCNITTSLSKNTDHLNDLITWTLNNTALFTDKKSGIKINSVITPQRHLLSELSIKHVDRKHAGIYACSPSNVMHLSETSNIQVARYPVRVTQERKPAQLRSPTSSTTGAITSTSATSALLLTSTALLLLEPHS